MASATGIPQHPPINNPDDGGEQGDLEPLLGRPGDASQRDNAPIIKNLVLGMLSPSSIVARLVLPLGRTSALVLPYLYIIIALIYTT